MIGLLCLALVPSADAADNKKKTTTTKAKPAPEMNVLIKGRGRGGFGAPEFGVVMIDGAPATRIGGRGGWVISKSLIVGGYGESITGDASTGTPYRITDGGLFVEGHVMPDSAVHLSIDGGIAAGSVRWGDDAGPCFSPYAAARLELNVVTWLRASAGPSMRTVVSGALPDDVSGLSIGGDILLKFGAF